jgi:hypothetical protein
MRRLLVLVVVLLGALLGASTAVAVAAVRPGAGLPEQEAGMGSPRGRLDTALGAAGGVRVSGWAFDPDTVAPIYVWVAVDGAGRHLYAAERRPDVGAAYPGAGSNHGFAATLPAAPGPHRVCATAANVFAGRHTALGCRAVAVPGGSPIGNFERAAGVVGGVDLRGWALDGDRVAPVYVWVTVDGAGRHVLADVDRPDVAAAFPGFGPRHGFAATVPARGGAHRVCATVANVGPGAHRSLGCRDVTVPGTPRLSSYEADVLRLTNDARAEEGIAPLAAHECASAQAGARAEALLAAPSLVHAPLGPVLEACRAFTAAENLARGSWTPQAMVDAWLASPGHRANLLDPGLHHLGVGCYHTAGGATLCAQVFLGG